VDKALDEVSPLLVDPVSINVSYFFISKFGKKPSFLCSQNLQLLLLEEKYLELLESSRELEALHCLRQEIAGLPLHDHEKKQKMHHLAGCVQYIGDYQKGESLHMWFRGFYHSDFKKCIVLAILVC